MKETKHYTGCNVKVRWEDLAEDDEDLNEEPVDYFSKVQPGGSSKKK